MIWLFICIISLKGMLGGITFEELTHITPNEPIKTEIRGFAFENSEGRWILSQNPDLRSCCVGSKANVLNQIYLEGTIPPGLKANASVHLSGKLYAASEYDEQGNLTAYYHLENAEEVPLATPWTTLGCLLLMGFGGLLGVKMKKGSVS